MIDPSWIAALGVILFGVGLLGTFYHKNAIVVLTVSYTHLTLPTTLVV